ncbi:MAG: DNA-binding CsgD family transcriptional regulator [Bradymonadia bacterium]|jgi:DNA-binding CsgD family transcriptional regulator
MSVRVATLRDSSGFKGLALYVSRAARTRPIAEATTSSIGASLRASYSAVERGLGTSAMVVWGPDDAVLGATEGARAWLRGSPDRFDAAARLVHTCGASTDCIIENVVVRSTPIEGTATLVMNLAPAVPVPVAVTASLSPRIREAAEFAAFGATAAEIARTMEISVETVRGYLKSAYKTLGVCNRVELARSLGSVH